MVTVQAWPVRGPRQRKPDIELAVARVSEGDGRSAEAIPGGAGQVVPNGRATSLRCYVSETAEALIRRTVRQGPPKVLRTGDPASASNRWHIGCTTRVEHRRSLKDGWSQ